MNNVLFVVDEKKMGGVSILLEDILPQVEAKNVDLLILHNNGSRLNKIKGVNIIYGTKFFEIIDISFKDILKSKNIINILKKIVLFFDMKTGLIKNKILKERKKIIKRKYDIEIAFKDGFCAIFTAYGNTPKKIHWLHYDYKNFNPNIKYKKLFNNILPKFDKIVAVSEKVGVDFNEIYHLDDRTIIIPNYINVDRIKKSLVDSKKNNSKKLSFICVGRLHQIKGYDRLIKVFHQLHLNNKIEDVLLEIYGDGPEKDRIIKMIKEFSLENIIKIKGQIDNPYKKMQQADMLILPSYFESFGIVIVESMTCGTPVLACKTSATSELIKDGYNGIEVENSYNGLFKGLCNILENKNIIKRLSKNLLSYDYNKKNDETINKINNLLKWK